MKPLKTSWEVQEGNRAAYLDISYNEVVVGAHHGNPQTDNAGSCSHEEFLAGRFHDIVREGFGVQVLRDAIKAVEHAGEYEPFNERRAHVQRIRDTLDLIPENLALRSILNNKETTNGNRAYGNAGGYKTISRSTTTTLQVERSVGYIDDAAGKRHPFTVRGLCSGVVEQDDHYYLVQSDNFTVLSPDGEILFDTTSNERDPLFGNELRLSSVFKNGVRVLVSYTWINPRNGRNGLLLYETGKGFTGKCDLDA